MPRRVQVHFVSLKSSLVNLPISLYAPLLERNVRPQRVAVILSKTAQNPKQDVYVGWTGMLAASSVARFSGVMGGGGGQDAETVEMDPQFAAGLGYAEGDIVEVGLAHDLPHAKMVGTEPLTADDWEIIELHAEHVENTLLSQVRVATVGQEVNVWVHGQTRVRLRVTALDPNAKALLLTTDTEVSIAPKARKALAANGVSSANRLAKVSASNTSAHSQAKVPKNSFSAILRVLPSSLVDGLPEAGEEPVVCLPLHMLIRAAQLGSLPPGSANSCSARLVRLKPPVDPEDAPTGAQSPMPESKVLDLGRSAVTSQDGESAQRKDGIQASEVAVVGLRNLPEGQVVVVGGVGPGLGEAKEWDLVRQVLLTISAVSSLKVERRMDSPALLRQPTRAPTHSLAGVDDVLSSCTDFCRSAFNLHKYNLGSGMQGLLITGRPGSGKTEVSKAIARGLQVSQEVFAFSRYIDLSRYKDKPVRVLREMLTYWRDKALWHRPSVLVLDNLDNIVPAEVEHADSFRNRHLAESFISIFNHVPNVVLIATAQHQDALHPALGSTHIFKKVLSLRPPDKNARKQILEYVLRLRLEKAEGLSLDSARPPNIIALATETEGYSATDLQDLVARAVHQAAIRTAAKIELEDVTTLSAEDFSKAKEGFVPLSLRDVPLQTSTVAWSDVGGLGETRRVLRETLEWPTKYAAIFKQSPLRLRSGLLLYGYPGCGKTLLASAIARECGLNFISIKGPELLNKYIGASEKSVRDVFERASAAKPCVLFFDEFDSIAPKRGHDSTGVTDRVVNQLLTLMDGAEGLDGVYILAATSRPDLIDSALLRPGRLDKALLCNMPTVDERAEILAAHARKLAVSPTVNFSALAARTDGFSGADLQALVYNAHLELVHADMHVHATLASQNANEESERDEFVTFGAGLGQGVRSRAEKMALKQRLRRLMSSSPSLTMKAVAKPMEARESVTPDITSAHFEKALVSARPSISAEEISRLSRIYSTFVSDRSGDLPVPSDDAGVGKRATLM